MSTGDLKNNVRRLQSELKNSRFTGEPDLRGLVAGSPPAFLPLLHFALLSYSYPLAVHLADRGYDLYGKNDARFVDVLYKLLRDEFSYQPRLTKKQLLSRSGYAEHKAILVSDVLRMCRQQDAALVKQGPPPAKPVTTRSLASLAQRKASVPLPQSAFEHEKGRRQLPGSDHHQPLASRAQAVSTRRPLQNVRNLSNSAKVMKHNSQTKPSAPRKVVLRQSHVQSDHEHVLDKENLESAPVADLSGQFDLHSNCVISSVSSGEFDGGMQKPEHSQSAANLRPLVTTTTTTGTAFSNEYSSRQATDVPPSEKTFPTFPAAGQRVAAPGTETWSMTGNSQSVAQSSAGDSSMPSAVNLVRSQLGMSQAARYQLAGHLPSPAAPRPSTSRFRQPLLLPSSQSSHQPAMLAEKETTGCTVFGNFSNPRNPLESARNTQDRRVDGGDTQDRRVDGGGLARQCLSAQTQPEVHARESQLWPQSQIARGRHHLQRDPELCHVGSQEEEQQQMERHQGHAPQQLSAEERNQPCGLEKDPLLQCSSEHYQLSEQAKLSSHHNAYIKGLHSVQALHQSGKMISSGQVPSHQPLIMQPLQSHSESLCCAQRVATDSSNLDQFKIQMDTISTQLGHLGSQLNQLVLADRSRACGPSEASMQLLPADSQSSSRFERVLENMNARMVLLETRLQQLESQTAGSNPSVGDLQRCVLPAASHNSNDQMIGFVQPPVSSVPTKMADIPDIAPSSRQDSAKSTNACQGSDDSRHHALPGDNTCSTVITERRAITVATPHRDGHTKAMSTVSMDISYVFSDPQMQAYVSGVNSRLRQTRSILRSMTAPHTVSSTLEQQLLLASAGNRQSS